MVTQSFQMIFANFRYDNFGVTSHLFFVFPWGLGCILRDASTPILEIMEIFVLREKCKLNLCYENPDDIRELLKIVDVISRYGEGFMI